MRFASCFIVSLVLSVVLNEALKFSDAGVNDWTINGIGRVSHYATLEGCKSGCDQIFVGTETGVVALLDAANGTIYWRVTHGEDDTVVYLIAGTKYLGVVTLRIESVHDERPVDVFDGIRFKRSSPSVVLRVYEQSNGILIWEKTSKCTSGTLTQPCSMDWDMRFVTLPNPTQQLYSEAVEIISENRVELIGFSISKSYMLLWSTAIPTSQLFATQYSNREVVAQRFLPGRAVLASSPVITPAASLNHITVNWVIFWVELSSGYISAGLELDSQSASVNLTRHLDGNIVTGDSYGRQDIHIMSDCEVSGVKTECTRILVLDRVEHLLQLVSVQDELNALKRYQEKAIPGDPVAYLIKKPAGSLRKYLLMPMITTRLKNLGSPPSDTLAQLSLWKVRTTEASIVVTNGWDTIVLNPNLELIAKLDGLWISEHVEGSMNQQSLLYVQLASNGTLKLSHTIGVEWADIGITSNQLLQNRNSLSSIYPIRLKHGGLYLILSTQDSTLICISVNSNNENEEPLKMTVQWIREESLSSIETVNAYTMPIEEILSIEPSLTNLFHPYKLLSSAESTFFNYIIPAIKDFTNSILALFDATNPTQTDHPPLDPMLPIDSKPGEVLKRLGIQNGVGTLSKSDKEYLSGKILIASTCSQRILGIHWKTGTVIWSYGMTTDGDGTVGLSFPKSIRCSPSIHGNVVLGRGFMNGRTNTHIQIDLGQRRKPAGHPVLDLSVSKPAPRLILLQTDTVSDSIGVIDSVIAVLNQDLGELVWMSPRTGEILNIEKLVNNNKDKIRIKSMVSVRLDSDGANNRNREGLVIITDDDYRLSCHLPSTILKSCFSQEWEKPLKHLYLYDITNSGIEGYNILYFNQSNIIGHLQLQWKISLPNIVASATPSVHRSPIHFVPVHVRGDVSVLNKLASSNLLAVVTHSFNASSAGGQTKNYSLTLMVIDTVAGQILISQILPSGATLPASIIVKENRVLVHYWNFLRTRFELLSVELYYDVPDEGPWRMLFSRFNFLTSSSKSISNHSLLHPFIFDKTFIFPTPARALGFSTTHRGITPQSLLIAAPTGHIYSIPDKLLSPRRPYIDIPKDTRRGKTPEEREEGLPYYNAILPLIHTNILSYDQPLNFIRGIVTDATHLESTSVIFAYGLDLFSSLIQPAAAFDAVSSSFNHALLVTILVLVVTLVIGTRKLARAKELLNRWK